jgi:hypothetical protein
LGTDFAVDEAAGGNDASNESLVVMANPYLRLPWDAWLFVGWHACHPNFVGSFLLFSYKFSNDQRSDGRR